MPSLTANEIITYKHKRNFIQFGGPRPGQVVQYAGQDAQYMSIEGVGVPESGGVDPIWVPDPTRIGQYRLVGRQVTPPELASATLMMLEKHGSIPRQLGRIGCQFNLYELTGDCKDLSDFLRGWTDYVLIYARALVTDKDLGTRTAWDSDEQVQDSLSLVLEDVYPVGALAFGEGASTQVDREVLDIVYGSKEQCGDCGPQDDGTKRIYAVTKSSGAGSPGLPAEVTYSLDGGATWTDANITGIGASADPNAIDIVGDKLVVVVGSEGAYYWSTLNRFTGVPGAFTKVTTGFVATKTPTDIYVASAREVYFSALGGYVYKSTDITAGVSMLNAAATTTADLQRIDGRDETIVAVGASDTIIKSLNRGATFAVTEDSTPSGIGDTIQALEVLDALRYWIGTSSGRVYYTLTGGASWIHKAFSGAGAGQVRDVVFATDEVGFFSFDSNTPTANIFATINGGEDWANDAPRITGLPTFNRATRLAVPNASPSIAANNLAVGGLSGGGTDGILLLGIASRL